MALTSGREVLGAARGGGYAVPAFNIFNLEMLQAALRAAEVERAPVIVQISPRSIAYAGLHPLAALATALAERVPSSRPRTPEARPPRPSWDRSGTRATSTCQPSSPIPRKRAGSSKRPA